MRGTVGDLASPYPLHTLLPAVLQEDQFIVKFISGLDDVLAPAISSVDCLAAYLDPQLAPEDFLQWLASSLGHPLDEGSSLHGQRRAVANAIQHHRLRGTAAGLRAQLESATEGRVEISDSGGVTWSQSPTADVAGGAAPRIVVQLVVDEPDAVDVARVESIIRAGKPAHVPHQLEVRST